MKGPKEAPTKGLHLAFGAENREIPVLPCAGHIIILLKDWHSIISFNHRKAGTKNNGAPGVRSYTPGYYAAYVLDLDGNNIEVVHI